MKEFIRNVVRKILKIFVFGSLIIVDIVMLYMLFGTYSIKLVVN